MHQLGPVVLVAASIMPIISKPLMYLFSQFDGLTEASMHFAAVLTVCSIVRSCQRLVTWQVFRPREFVTSCVVVGHVSNDLVSLQKIFFFTYYLSGTRWRVIFLFDPLEWSDTASAMRTVWFEVWWRHHVLRPIFGRVQLLLVTTKWLSKWVCSSITTKLLITKVQFTLQLGPDNVNINVIIYYALEFTKVQKHGHIKWSLKLRWYGCVLKIGPMSKKLSAVQVGDCWCLHTFIKRSFFREPSMLSSSVQASVKRSCFH